MNHFKYIGIGLCTALFIGGCATNKNESSQPAGFLGDYSNLELVKNNDGTETRRWIDPKIKKGQYPKLIVVPVAFYPKPKATEQIPVETLQGIRSYTTEALHRELGKSFVLVHEREPDVAHLRVVITGLKTETEGWSDDEAAYLLVEASLEDSLTSRQIGKAVRKIHARKLLENYEEQLTADMMHSAIDDAASGTRMLFEQVLK